MEVGIAKAAMMVERRLPIKSNTTNVTNSAPKYKVRMVSLTARFMYLD